MERKQKRPRIGQRLSKDTAIGQIVFKTDALINFNNTYSKQYVTYNVLTKNVINRFISI